MNTSPNPSYSVWSNELPPGMGRFLVLLPLALLVASWILLLNGQ